MKTKNERIVIVNRTRSAKTPKNQVKKHPLAGETLGICGVEGIEGVNGLFTMMLTNEKRPRIVFQHDGDIPDAVRPQVEEKLAELLQGSMAAVAKIERCKMPGFF